MHSPVCSFCLRLSSECDAFIAAPEASICGGCVQFAARDCEQQKKEKALKLARGAQRHSNFMLSMRRMMGAIAAIQEKQRLVELI